MSTVQRYHILGNGWNAATATAPELAFFVSLVTRCQEFRAGSGRALIAAGVPFVHKYAMGGGQCYIGAAAAGSERALVESRCKGLEAAPYNVDIRLKNSIGGNMESADGRRTAIDLCTAGNAEHFADILAQSIDADIAQGSNPLNGIFLDSMATLSFTSGSYAGQTPGAAYTDALHHAGMKTVINELKAVYPSHEILINCGAPTKGRSVAIPPTDLVPSPDYTGVDLLLDSDADVGMWENNALTAGLASDWTAAACFDIERALVGLKKVVFSFHFDRGLADFAKARAWALMVYLLATAGSSDAWLSFDGSIDDTADELPDFPEMVPDLTNLGNATGGIALNTNRLSRGFDNGRVLVNCNVGGASFVETVEDGKSLPVFSGGGAFPASGTATWTETPAANVTITPPDPGSID